MWFAVAILGIIGIATGITLLPGGAPHSAPASSAAPSSPAAPPAPDDSQK